jgi:hypothetical protein
MIGKGSIVDTKAVQSLARKQGISDLGIGDIKTISSNDEARAEEPFRERDLFAQAGSAEAWEG